MNKILFSGGLIVGLSALFCACGPATPDSVSTENAAPTPSPSPVQTGEQCRYVTSQNPQPSDGNSIVNACVTSLSANLRERLKLTLAGYQRGGTWNFSTLDENGFQQKFPITANERSCLESQLCSNSGLENGLIIDF